MVVSRDWWSPVSVLERVRFSSECLGAAQRVESPRFSVLTSLPRDFGARVSQGHLKLSPSPC